MVILHALSQTELTGSEAYAQDLVSYQLDQGFEVHVISDKFHLNFKSSKGLKAQLLTFSLATNSFWRRMKNIVLLRKWLKLKKIEVIHSHSRGACRHFYWASLGLKIPMLTTIHGYQHSSWSKKIFDIYGDYALVVCEKIGLQLEQVFGRPKYKWEVLPNPIAAAKNLNSHSEVSEPKLLLAGRNSGPKGRRLKAIALALAENNSRFSSVKLVLSGLGDHERQTLQKNLGSRFEVFGDIPNFKDQLSTYPFVVGSGRIALEALAAGCDVFAVGESKSVGWLTDSNWEKSLASNMGDVGPEQELVVLDVVEALNQRPLGFSPEARHQLFTYFDASRIQERVVDLYRGLRIHKRTGWIPILMYHRLVEQNPKTEHQTFINFKRFEKHLIWLKKWGKQSIHFKDLSDFWYERRPLSELPLRPVILSFDDGYVNNLSLGQELLQKHNSKAVLYLLADSKIKENFWDSKSGEELCPIMSQDQRKKLDLKVFEIASHGLRHERLPLKNDVEVLSELTESKKMIENEFGIKISSFAYSFGDIDPRLWKLCQKAEYDFGVNTDKGPGLWFTNRWSLFRVNIFPQDGYFQLWKKTRRNYRLRKL